MFLCLYVRFTMSSPKLKLCLPVRIYLQCFFFYLCPFQRPSQMLPAWSLVLSRAASGRCFPMTKLKPERTDDLCHYITLHIAGTDSSLWCCGGDQKKKTSRWMDIKMLTFSFLFFFFAAPMTWWTSGLSRGVHCNRCSMWSLQVTQVKQGCGG